MWENIILKKIKYKHFEEKYEQQQNHHDVSIKPMDDVLQYLDCQMPQ